MLSLTLYANNPWILSLSDAADKGKRRRTSLRVSLMCVVVVAVLSIDTHTPSTVDECGFNVRVCNCTLSGPGVSPSSPHVRRAGVSRRVVAPVTIFLGAEETTTTHTSRISSLHRVVAVVLMSNALPRFLFPSFVTATTLLLLLPHSHNAAHTHTHTRGERREEEEEEGGEFVRKGGSLSFSVPCECRVSTQRNFQFFVRLWSLQGLSWFVGSGWG